MLLPNKKLKALQFVSKLCRVKQFAKRTYQSELALHMLAIELNRVGITALEIETLEISNEPITAAEIYKQKSSEEDCEEPTKETEQKTNELPGDTAQQKEGQDS